jgi:hypothetical protein
MPVLEVASFGSAATCLRCNSSYRQVKLRARPHTVSRNHRGGLILVNLRRFGYTDRCTFVMIFKFE